VCICGISSRFQLLSPRRRQVTHALLTRPPLSHLLFLTEVLKKKASFDLHVLGTPPAFILSQDQTLILKNLIDNSSLKLKLFVLYCVSFGYDRSLRSIRFVSHSLETCFSLELKLNSFRIFRFVLLFNFQAAVHFIMITSKVKVNFVLTRSVKKIRTFEISVYTSFSKEPVT
jgi:hypothetical protein